MAERRGFRGFKAAEILGVLRALDGRKKEGEVMENGGLVGRSDEREAAMAAAVKNQRRDLWKRQFTGGYHRSDRQCKRSDQGS